MIIEAENVMRSQVDFFNQKIMIIGMLEIVMFYLCNERSMGKGCQAFAGNALQGTGCFVGPEWITSGVYQAFCCCLRN